MNTFLHYLIAGSAFAAGVMIMTSLVALALSKRPASKDLAEYWQTSIDHQRQQLDLITRQVAAVQDIAKKLKL